MLRTITFSLLMLATAQLAAADDKATSTLAAASAPAAESTQPTKDSTDDDQAPVQEVVGRREGG